ncbi:hypothetical protein QUF64_05305 [Anaerolineales bacterium HSG6]|nr:hypothetical protein [Anaerolineales bacterium HSG6]
MTLIGTKANNEPITPTITNIFSIWHTPTLTITQGELIKQNGVILQPFMIQQTANSDDSPVVITLTNQHDKFQCDGNDNQLIQSCYYTKIFSPANTHPLTNSIPIEVNYEDLDGQISTISRTFEFSFNWYTPTLVITLGQKIVGQDIITQFFTVQHHITSNDKSAVTIININGETDSFTCSGVDNSLSFKQNCDYTLEVDLQKTSLTYPITVTYQDLDGQILTISETFVLEFDNNSPEIMITPDDAKAVTHNGLVSQTFIIQHDDTEGDQSPVTVLNHHANHFWCDGGENKLSEGESCHYVVRHKPIENNPFTHTVTVWYQDLDGQTATISTTFVYTHTWRTYLSPIIKQPRIPALTMTVKADHITATYQDTIQYIYHITNTGNVPLSIDLVDNKANITKRPDTPLGVGQSTTGHGSYAVGVADLFSITNVATARGEYEGQSVSATGGVSVDVPTTELSAQSNNAGDITVNIKLAADETVTIPSCDIGNNQTEFCRNLHANIAYKFEINTRCGRDGITKMYDVGEQLLKITCR